MSVCKMYFVLLLVYVVINLLGERSQTARTGERREKRREESRREVSPCFCSKRFIRESDFIFVFLRVFRTECTYLDAEDFVVSKFAKYPVRERRPALFRETPADSSQPPPPGTKVCFNSSQPTPPGTKVCFNSFQPPPPGTKVLVILCCSNGEAVFCFWPRRTRTTYRYVTESPEG